MPTDTTPTTPEADPINPLAEAFKQVNLGDGAPQNQADAPDFVSNLLAELDTPASEPEKPAEEPETEQEPEAPAAEVEVADKPKGATSDKAIATWGEMKKELRELREEREKLLEQINSAPSPTDSDELATLKAQIAELQDKASAADEMEKKLAIASVRDTREFKRAITEPLEKIGERVAKLAEGSEDLDASALLEAFAERDPKARRQKLSSLVSPLEDIDRIEVLRLADDALAIFAKADELEERAEQARDEVQRREQEETARENLARKARFQKAVDTFVGDLKDRIPFLPLADGEVVEDVLKTVAEKSKSVDILASDHQIQAWSVMAGILVPRLIKQHRKLADEKSSLEARLAELSEAGATTTSRTSTPSTTTPVKPGDFVSSVMAQLHA